jgi:hypothetical protein
MSRLTPTLQILPSGAVVKIKDGTWEHGVHGVHGARGMYKSQDEVEWGYALLTKGRV